MLVHFAVDGLLGSNFLGLLLQLFHPVEIRDLPLFLLLLIINDLLFNPFHVAQLLLLSVVLRLLFQLLVAHRVLLHLLVDCLDFLPVYHQLLLDLCLFFYQAVLAFDFVGLHLVLVDSLSPHKLLLLFGELLPQQKLGLQLSALLGLISLIALEQTVLLDGFVFIELALNVGD